MGLPTHVLAALDGGAAACEGALMRVEPSALLSTWRCSCLCARTGAFPDTMVGAAVPAVRSFLHTAYRRRLCGAAPLLAHHQLIHRDWASAIRCWQRPPFPGVGRARSAGADVPHRYVCELRRRGVVVACARACFAPVVAHVHTHTDSFEVAHSAEVERIRSTTAGDMPEDKDMTRLGYAMIPAPIAEAVRENAAVQAVVVKQLTLVLLYCEKQGKILLAMKKRGFGEGKYNGFGGKVEPGETILEGALREFREECRASVPADKLMRRGVLTFVFGGSHKVMQVHLFTGSPDAMVGEAQETEEMRPEWFSLDAVPFERMWADDRF